ncbi:MAG: hypothetical protein F4Y05_09040 [Acidimicrobiaceae bacterium]|nr:hypothetical protein [Acidimicrobiaceae bacterium]
MPAISVGKPRRFMGTIGQLSRAACMASSLPSSASDMGVSSGPGLTQLTVPAATMARAAA